MKGKLHLLIGTVLGMVIGWTLGYLRLPLVEQRDSFWVGFVSSLAVVAFVLSLIYVWNHKSLMFSIFSKNNPRQSSSRRRSLKGMLLALFVLANCLFGAFILNRQNDLFTVRNAQQETRIQEQVDLVESIRASKQGALMGNVLAAVEKELAEGTNGKLSPATLSRISALSHACQPYKYIDGDSLSLEKLSPERGQLLLSLAFLPLDSSTYAEIKQKTTFAGADLRGANLKGLDLEGIDLENANLKDADLTSANLQKANLRRANLWGTKLDSVDLSGSDLVRADLSWGKLNQANLKHANFDGANLSNAQLRDSKARGATFQWSKFDNALLNGANFEEANLFGGHLVKTNLSNVNLSRTDLRKAVLDEANLTGVELEQATIREKNWLETLDKWQMTGFEQIQAKYKVVEDTSGRYKYADWCLKKKAN